MKRKSKLGQSQTESIIWKNNKKYFIIKMSKWSLASSFWMFSLLFQLKLITYSTQTLWEFQYLVTVLRVNLQHQKNPSHCTQQWPVLCAAQQRHPHKDLIPLNEGVGQGSGCCDLPQACPAREALVQPWFTPTGTWLACWADMALMGCHIFPWHLPVVGWWLGFTRAQEIWWWGWAMETGPVHVVLGHGDGAHACGRAGPWRQGPYMWC